MDTLFDKEEKKSGVNKGLLVGGLVGIVLIAIVILIAIQRPSMDDHDGFTLLLSKLNWLVWILLLGLIVAAAWMAAFVWAPQFVPFVWLRILLFLAFVLAVLNTI